MTADDTAAMRPVGGAQETGSKEAAVEEVTRRYLMYAVLPTYLATGFLDYLMHRRSDIEHTTGWPESAVHVVEMVEVGAPIVMTLLLEVDPPVLLAAAGGALVHMATAVLDLRLATHGRVVHQAEQHVHTFLEGLPFLATSVLAAGYADRVAAVFRRQPVHWGLRRKRHPLPRTYLRAAFAGIAAFIVLPYAEELLRCVAASGGAERSLTV